MSDSKLMASICRHEGLRLKLYKCPAGKLTIGWGHNIEDLGISKDVANLMLREDIDQATKSTQQIFPLVWKFLSEKRKIVLINMMFNLGNTRFLTFKNMIKAVRDENFSQAALEMKDSLWYKQVTTRAEELIKLMKEG